MNKQFPIKNILPLFLIILSIPKILVLSGCANIVPPQGGPRDSLPPVLLQVTPKDSSINFKSRTITFTFDEYINQLQNVQENLLITPTPTIIPGIEVKLKTITVRLKDTLEPNTTYNIRFGNMIKDVNEGNVLKDFSYLFTTGNYFDSLELTGKVILAETGKIDTTLVVMLHKNGYDSAVVKETPRYVAKLDGRGNFRFRYLPSGTYYIYALKDEGGTRKYFGGSQLFAFADSAVEIKPAAQPITLYAFGEKKEQVISGGVTLSPGGRPGATPADNRRLRYSPNLINNVQDLLNNFVFSFEQPLRYFDSSKIQVSTDSTYNTLTGYSWLPDSLKKKYTLNIDWKEGTRYNMILDKEFAEDTLGRKLLKTDTLVFSTKKKSDYASFRILFRNLDLSKNPVLQFVQNDVIQKSFPLASGTFTQALFIPGEYELRILYDDNKNGKWDPGNFFGKRKQPELVNPVERKINVKAGQGNEFDIQL